MHSLKTGSTINLTHFLSEINKAEVTGKQQMYQILQITDIYFHFISHIYRFHCFLQNETEVFGCFIN